MADDNMFTVLVYFYSKKLILGSDDVQICNFQKALLVYIIVMGQKVQALVYWNSCIIAGHCCL